MANEKKMDCVILGLLSHESLTGYEIKKKNGYGIKVFLECELRKHLSNAEFSGE